MARSPVAWLLLEALIESLCAILAIEFTRLAGPVSIGFASFHACMPPRRRPLDPDTCTRCGYDVTSLPAPICPECGSSLIGP